MLHGFVRLVQIAVLLAALLPALVLAAAYSIVLSIGSAPAGRPVPSVGQASAHVLLLLAGALATFVAARLVLTRARAFLDSVAARQADALDALGERWIAASILGSAAASLFLELAVIRWLGEIVPLFALYKNFGLLACFAGLGLGYALGRRDSIPLVLSVPLLLIQTTALLVVRYGLQGWHFESLWITPVREQQNMGIGTATSAEHFIAIFALLTTVFLLTALAFVPVGQLCGRLLSRDREPLRAYGFNLLGSLAGVALMMAASALWTPPAVWFGLTFALLLAFQLFDSRVLLASAVAGLLGVVLLAWPVRPGLERIHSPYQLLERGPGDRGLTLIAAAGHYYQRVHDLSLSNLNRSADDLAWKARHYELVYRVLPKPASRVAIVGAGMGNDVAAALRAGAQAVDAVEIDPAILLLGRMYHPEQPYDDPRTRTIVDDARSFLRTTDRSYDVIVFGLLDSHTLASHASSVRLDSFVYTVEALREVRARLNPGGVLSLAFTVLSDEMSAKIYGMLREAFDGSPPLCVFAGYDTSWLFLQSREGDLRVDPATLAALGLEDIGPNVARHVDETDLATDDWPFFYMPRRVYPLSYLGMIAIVVLLSILLVRALGLRAPQRGGWAFFFLGAGFMLVETKAITELGLKFGNTWHVVGITIAGVLIMGYLANAAIRAAGARHWAGWAALLLASLLGGYLVSAAGGLAAASTAGKVGTLAIVTMPVLFGGALFSTWLASFKDIGGAMAMNLLGAMVGGLLEYNAMYFGYQSLYLLAMGLYALAAASIALKR